jgi:hypothetical protein
VIYLLLLARGAFLGFDCAALQTGILLASLSFQLVTFLRLSLTLKNLHATTLLYVPPPPKFIAPSVMSMKRAQGMPLPEYLTDLRVVDALEVWEERVAAKAAANGALQ